MHEKVKGKIESLLNYYYWLKFFFIYHHYVQSLYKILQWRSINVSEIINNVFLSRTVHERQKKVNLLQVKDKALMIRHAIDRFFWSFLYSITGFPCIMHKNAGKLLRSVCDSRNHEQLDVHRSYHRTFSWQSN